MIALDFAGLAPLAAPEDDLGPQGAEGPPTKTAFDASLDPLLQELEAAVAGDAIVEEEEPIEPPPDDGDADQAPPGMLLEAFLLAHARPEELHEEAGRPGANDGSGPLDGGPRLGGAAPDLADRGAAPGDAAPAVEGVAADAVEGAPAPSFEATSGGPARAPVEARGLAQPADARPPPRGPSPDVAPAPRARAQATEAARSPRAPEAAPIVPAPDVEVTSRVAAAARQTAATQPSEAPDVGRRRSSPPTAERPPTSGGDVAPPIAFEVPAAAQSTDVGEPTVTARIPSTVTDPTLARAADGSMARAVRAAESLGHRRALAGEARGRIVAPELGGVEVIARIDPHARVDVVVRADEPHGRRVIAAAQPELVAHVHVEVPRAAVHVEGAATLGAGASASHERHDGREPSPREPRDEASRPGFTPARRGRARFVL